MKMKKTFSLLTMLVIKKNTTIHNTNSGTFSYATPGSRAKTEERRITTKKKDEKVGLTGFSRGARCPEKKTPI